MGRTMEQRQLDAENKRKCIKCNTVKSKTDDFSVRRYYYNPDGSIKYITYDSRCKKCMFEYSKELKFRSPMTYCAAMIGPLRHRAKEKNLPFNVNKDDLFDQWEKQNGECFYTGIPLDLSLQTPNRKSPHKLFPFIDKQDPILGYVRGNIVWCTYVVNRMKSDLTHNEFINFCKIVIDKFGGNNG